MRQAIPALLLSLAPLAASGQSLPDPSALADRASEAAQSVRDIAGEHLLIASMIGREVIGPDGGAVGTVEDFAVLPGGNLVAAVVSRGDGARIALPWDAVKAGVAAGEPVGIPFTAAEIDGQEALRDLADALGL
jgi:sporulation protein YlmC with PRC-barrel domain